MQAEKNIHCNAVTQAMHNKGCKTYVRFQTGIVIVLLCSLTSSVDRLGEDYKHSSCVHVNSNLHAAVIKQEKQICPESCVFWEPLRVCILLLCFDLKTSVTMYNHKTTHLIICYRHNTV